MIALERVPQDDRRHSLIRALDRVPPEDPRRPFLELLIRENDPVVAAALIARILGGTP